MPLLEHPIYAASELHRLRFRSDPCKMQRLEGASYKGFRQEEGKCAESQSLEALYSSCRVLVGTRIQVAGELFDDVTVLKAQKVDCAILVQNPDLLAVYRAIKYQTHY